MENEGPELSDAAKAEIAEAVHIVAEDKLYRRMLGNAKPTDPTPETPPTDTDPAIPADPNAPVSPPAKADPVEPPTKKKSGLYWGEESD